MPDSRNPAVSIVMPTYNRATFLPQAFAAVRAQSFTDWELIVVDDGSTDATRQAVEVESAKLSQPVRYVTQANQGPYGARNTGLDLATGDAVAFYDTDDVWLPHHLTDCVTALTVEPQVDWVYGSSRIEDHPSGRVVNSNAFYDEAGRPRPFLRLRTRTAGRLRVIDDPGSLACAIRTGLYCGLQCSVIRRRVFAGRRFEAASRNEAEDQLFSIQQLAAGRRFAYYDAVHLVYNVHAENSSATPSAPVDKQVRILQAMTAGFERLPDEARLGAAERRAWRRRLAHDYFWNLGYRLLTQGDRIDDALAYMRRGLRKWPWDWRYWKTYALARLRTVRRRPAPPVLSDTHRTN